MPSVANPLAPITFVNKIHVPVYLACQFTDEQTGGHCADLAQHFTGTSRKWFTFTNGAHVDSLDPQTFNRWYDFLELYVAHRRPQLSDTTKALAPTVFAAAMGINDVTLPPDPIQAQPTYRRSSERLPGAQADPRDVRQRRGQRHTGRALPGVRAVLLAFPGPWHAGAVLVPGLRRDPRGRQGQERLGRRVHLEPEGALGHELHRR